MKLLTNYVLITFSVISLQLNAQNPIYYKGKCCKGYIFDSAQFVFKSIPDQQHRFTPSMTDIDKAEKILRQQIVQANGNNENQAPGCPVIPNRLKKYFRQYVGFVNSKRDKVIWINCFWNKELINEAEKDIVRVNDGCSYYWNIEVNIDKGSVSNFRVNGNG